MDRKMTKREAIADYVGTMLDDFLDDSPYLIMPNGESQPTWFEIRDAIMQKLFSIEHEMGRQELHAEQVREECL